MNSEPRFPLMSLFLGIVGVARFVSSSGDPLVFFVLGWSSARITDFLLRVGDSSNAKELQNSTESVVE